MHTARRNRNQRSADFQSAVSQVFNLRVARQLGGTRQLLRSADCKSAIQQSATLRYFGCGFAALGSSVVSVLLVSRDCRILQTAKKHADKAVRAPALKELLHSLP